MNIPEAIICVLLTAMLALTGTFIKIVWTHGDRILKIETFLSLVGQKFASILHSPHTPELDALLEIYIARDHEMNREQWKRLMELCEHTVNDPLADKEKVVMAGFLYALCEHKLSLPEKP